MTKITAQISRSEDWLNPFANLKNGMQFGLEKRQMGRNSWIAKTATNEWP